MKSDEILAELIVELGLGCDECPIGDSTDCTNCRDDLLDWARKKAREDENKDG